MKVSAKALFYSIVLVFGLIVCAPFVAAKSFAVNAQNRISGYVHGLNRQPMDGLYVELMDDLGRFLNRMRTTGSGRYEFIGMGDGRFVVRAITDGTYYAEKECTVEIQNFSLRAGDGQTRIVGRAHEYCDFSLTLRNGVTTANVAIFVQDIPDAAKKLYEKGVDDLDNKRPTEGIGKLKAALEIFPKYYDALDRLGTEYIKLGRPETFHAAAILFTNAVEVNPRGFKSWYGLAYSRYSLGAFSEALTAAQKAVEFNGSWPEGVFLLGVLMKNTKKYDEAEKQLLKAKELSKGTIPRVHWELAMLYAKDMKRYADAATELKLFLKAQPDSKDAENIKKLIADFEAMARAK